MKAVDDVVVAYRLQLQQTSHAAPAISSGDDRVMWGNSADPLHCLALDAGPAIAVFNVWLVEHLEVHLLWISAGIVRGEGLPKLEEVCNRSVSLPQRHYIWHLRLNIQDNHQAGRRNLRNSLVQPPNRRWL